MGSCHTGSEEPASTHSQNAESHPHDINPNQTSSHGRGQEHGPKTTQVAEDQEAKQPVSESNNADTVAKSHEQANEATTFNIYIEWESETQATLTLKVHETMKIYELKQIVGSIFNVEQSSFVLSHDNKELSDNGATLGSQEIQADDHVVLKKLMHNLMPYADPADVMPSMLLMRTALKWQKNETVASHGPHNSIHALCDIHQNAEEAKDPSADPDSMISITLQQEGESYSIADRKNHDREHDSGLPNPGPSSQREGREPRESNVPELKQKEEIFATTKKYLDKVLHARSAHQDTEQSELTECRDSTGNHPNTLFRDLYGPFYGISFNA